jgi:hypothetical protein
MFTGKTEAWEIQGPALATLLLLLLLLVAKKITKQLAGARNSRITRKSSQLHRCRWSHESLEANKKIANYYLHQIEKLSRWSPDGAQNLDKNWPNCCCCCCSSQKRNCASDRLDETKKHRSKKGITRGRREEREGARAREKKEMGSKRTGGRDDRCTSCVRLHLQRIPLCLATGLLFWPIQTLPKK